MERPPREGRRTGLLPRLMGLAALVGIGILVVRLLTGQPSEVEVAYHLAGAQSGLQELSVRYLRDGEEVRRVRFDYSRRAAPDTQLHLVQLLSGEHRVELELLYSGKVPAPLARHAVGAGPRVRLERPLIVDGGGRVTVYVAGESR